jgi:hypothetical protein
VRTALLPSSTESLSEAIERYSDFFELFDDFDGSVRFFLLDDLVDADSGQVKFSWGSTTLEPQLCRWTSPLYFEYRRLTIDFIHARNQRIASWAAEHLPHRVRGYLRGRRVHQL